MTDGDDTGPSGSAMSAILQEIRESQKMLDENFAQFRGEVGGRSRKGNRGFAMRSLMSINGRGTRNRRRSTTGSKKPSVPVLEGTSSGAVEKAKKNLEQGLALLSECQKLIKLADRSEHGRGVVAEYTADELAEDSDDEKRIFKAEKAAERKASTIPQNSADRMSS